MSKYIIGLDFGAGMIDIGVVDLSGEVVAASTIPANPTEGPDPCLDRVGKETKQILQGRGIAAEDVMGVGVGAPGPLDLRSGIMVSPPNLPRSWWGYPIRDKVERMLDLEASLDNDGNAATLAEGWLGEAQGCRDFIVLTLGMGVGGGVMSDRRILRGADGAAGELGHICVFPEGRKCTCGKRGCLEAYASANALVAMYQDQAAPAEDITAERIFELAAHGDLVAQAVLGKMAEALGVALGTLLNVFNPERIIIAGRLSDHFEVLRKNVEQQCQAHAYEAPFKRASIVTSGLREKNGIVGAAAIYAYEKKIIQNVEKAHTRIEFRETYPIVAAHVGASGMRFAVVELKENFASYDLKPEFWMPGNSKTQEEVLRRIGRGIQECIVRAGIPLDKIRGVSVVTPGTVDRKNKLVITSPNMPWTNVHIEREVHRRLPELKTEVFLARDAMALALSEKFFGQGRELRNFGVIYLGTGIGVGLIFEGRPYAGRGGYAGEIGHMTTAYGAKKSCKCGGVGCLECYASGIALCEYAMNYINSGKVSSLTSRERLKDLNYMDVLEAADGGDAVAQLAFQEMGERLAIGVRNLFNVLDLERVIVSGPLARGGKHFLEILRRTTDGAVVLAVGFRQLDIVLTDIKDNELVSAAAAFVDQTRENVRMLQ